MRRTCPEPVPFITVTAPPSTFCPESVMTHGLRAPLLPEAFASWLFALEHGANVTDGGGGAAEDDDDNDESVSIPIAGAGADDDVATGPK